MKNRKGYIPTMTVMLFLAFGSTIANAGIVIGQRVETTTCTEKTATDTVVSYLKKLSTFAITGIVIGQRGTAECTERNGIVIGQ